MLPTLILLISIGALSKFFISYCRSLLSSCSKLEVSDYAKQMTGIDGEAPREDAFPRIMQLVDLAPYPQADRSETFAIRLYYRTLFLSALAGRRWPAVRYWVTAEREDCAHFAAVALDRELTKITNHIT